MGWDASLSDFRLKVVPRPAGAATVFPVNSRLGRKRSWGNSEEAAPFLEIHLVQLSVHKPEAIA